MKAYLLALRKDFDGNLSFSYTGDKSRDSGVDWLAGHVYGFEAKVVGWVQPVATF
jgi:hypothetical protein